jgi:hypothetical protein
MVKLVLGLMTALLLASCADMGSTSAPAAPSAMTSGVGHPAGDLPGPRPY